jgi:hypothetical protein
VAVAPGRDRAGSATSSHRDRPGVGYSTRTTRAAARASPAATTWK